MKEETDDAETEEVEPKVTVDRRKLQEDGGVFTKTVIVIGVAAIVGLLYARHRLAKGSQ